MNKRTHLLSLCLLTICTLLILGGCTNQSKKSSSDKLNVVSTLDFYGETAKAVLGKNGTVTSLIDNPNIDPHDFEATTKTAKQTANADVIIRNGAGYDDWIKKLSDKKSISAARLMNVKDGQNEHLWYNPETMSRLADELAMVFSKKMPSRRAEFKQNAAAYKKKVARLNSELEKIRAERIEKPVAVSEPVFDYSLEKMGYKVANAHFAKAVEEESDPSYTDIKNLQNKIKRKEIAFFVYNVQSDGTTVKNIVNLCKKHDIPVVKVTETLPEGKNYFNWLQSEYRQIAEIEK